MGFNRLNMRRYAVGAGLCVALALGAAACGSSGGKTDTPAGASNTSVTTAPPTTAPSGGSVSY